jgi:hypothetical protein
MFGDTLEGDEAGDSQYPTARLPNRAAGMGLGAGSGSILNA